MAKTAKSTKTKNSVEIDAVAWKAHLQGVSYGKLRSALTMDDIEKMAEEYRSYLTKKERATAKRAQAGSQEKKIKA